MSYQMDTHEILIGKYITNVFDFMWHCHMININVIFIHSPDLGNKCCLHLRKVKFHIIEY